MFYADYNATSLVSDTHFDLINEKLKQLDGNPSSIHARGRGAKIVVEDAREQIAALIGKSSEEIIFTSGATEANNLLILGLIRRLSNIAIKGTEKPHVIYSAIEHPAVIEPIQALERSGYCSYDVASVTKNGLVDIEHLLTLIKENTALVCVMHANNEVGTIQPLAEIIDRVKAVRHSIHVHVDSVQMAGRRDIRDYQSLAVDSVALTAHKMGGFKGVGALYLKAGNKLTPLMFGGGQERKRRPGTENLPGILSFGLRAEDYLRAPYAWSKRVWPLYREMIKGLRGIPGVVLHGDHTNSVEPGSANVSELEWDLKQLSPIQLENTVNFHINRVPGEDVLLNLDLEGFCAASGSACSSGVGRPSHVLKALGYSDWEALNSIRVSFGARGSTGDVKRMVSVIKTLTDRLQSSDAGKVQELHC